jgi:sucrose-6F-phosphate phosphohydrolase
MNHTAKEYVLVTDLDSTVLGDEYAMMHFSDYVRNHEDKIAIIYASGRFCGLMEEIIRQTTLPEPRVLIGEFGSESCLCSTGHPVPGWYEKLSENWSVDLVREVLLDEPDMRLQAAEFQSPYRVSYLLRDAPLERLIALKEMLYKAGAPVRLIYTFNQRLNIVPEQGGKGNAAVFAAAYLGYPKERVICAGNSFHDASIFWGGCHGIEIRNHDDLARPPESSSPDRMYEARASYADGVIEGLEYWMKTGVEA